MATAAPTATGKVIQITGPVVDIEFPPGALPAIYNAVEILREGQDPLVCEVQQHLGNNWVRSVAMTTTDGLARGVEVRNTGAPISVPVGDVTLGRVFDVLGNAIDGKGTVQNFVRIVEIALHFVADRKILHRPNVIRIQAHRLLELGLVIIGREAVVPDLDLGGPGGGQWAVGSETSRQQAGDKERSVHDSS